MTELLVVRPAPWSVPPEGYEFVVVPDSDGGLEWVMPAISDGGCRFTVAQHVACRKPPVATLYRGRKAPGTKPYNYCAEHLYGRWIEGGEVVHWRLQEIAS